MTRQFKSPNSPEKVHAVALPPLIKGGDVKVTPKTIKSIGGFTLGIFFLLPVIALSADPIDQLVGLDRQIQEKRQQIEQLEQQQRLYQQKIAAAQGQSKTLKSQIGVIADRLAQLSLQVQQAELEIGKTQLEIQNLTADVSQRTAQIERRRTQLAEVIRAVQRQRQATIWEAFAEADGLRALYSRWATWESLQRQLHDGLAELRQQQADLQQRQTLAVQTAQNLTILRQHLADRQGDLADQRSYKDYLLISTRSDERRYQQLLEAARQEQERADRDVDSLEQAIRQKLASGGLAAIQGNGQLQWPISSRTITTQFRDPDYPFRRLFEHEAIDIRTPQGTPVRAAAAAYVAKVRDAGMGYSYILLVHVDGLSTVYGHLSSLLAKEGTYVAPGEIIGLSGGRPGTRGAGPLTTGPHLHFEVLKNGVRVNPLAYLGS